MPTKTRTARYTFFGLEVVENIGLIIIGLATVVAGYHFGHVRFSYSEDAVRPGSNEQPGFRKE